MKRSKQQLQRRPLLLQPTNHYNDHDSYNDDGVTRDGEQTKMTTSSQSIEVTRTPPKRRLRLFGALGGGGSSNHHHNNHNNHHHGNGGTQYTKQPPTPPPTSIRTTNNNNSLRKMNHAAVDECSPTSSSVPATKYDTRPIYTAPSNTSGEEQEYEQHHQQQHELLTSPPPPEQLALTTKTVTATPIPVLPRNEKDVKRRRGKADPPTRQEEEQVEQEKVAQKIMGVAAASIQKRAAEPKRSRSRSRTRNTNNAPPPPQQPQQPATAAPKAMQTNNRSKAAASKLGQAEPPQQASATKPAAAAPTMATRRRQSKTPPRPRSVLRSKSTPADVTDSLVVEEKKTDETERLVAQVILQQEQQQLEKAASQDPTRHLLSRPFGRSALPVHVGRKFVVEVSSAEWDADEDRWKYRILVQQRPGSSSSNNKAGTAAARGSFTTAYTWRSLADFAWLEQALRWEFHGALLVPLLNIAVGVTNVSATTAVPVESESLRHWLTDLLNGIRGQGEWLYLESCAARHDATTILQSEAMETFLYRTGSLTEEQLLAFTMFPGNRRTDKATGFVQRLTQSLEQLGPLAELCVGPMPQSSTAAVEYRFQSRNGKNVKPPRSIMCSSGALATAPSLDLLDSFGAESSTRHVHQEHPILLMHTLLRNYRETALQAMEKCSSLRPAEEALGVAWKRLAIALTNLFAYEKDVESAKLGDLKVKRENVPFRKVQKSHVDDGLRILSRQKVERCEAALTSVKDFLSALLADLSAVAPSVKAFREAHNFMQEQRVSSGASMADSTVDDTATSRGTSSYRQRRRPEWMTKTQNLLNIQRSDTNETQVNLFEERFQRNEKALEEALVRLIQQLPVRTARIAWRFWQTEIGHVAEIHKAAASLRSKVNVIKEDSVARMLKRHLEEEKQDKMMEILLIQRMLQIGHKEDSIEEPPETTRKRELALNIAKERLGRWDIKLGLAVMEAIGIQDPNIRVEETTRDLRLVRKYAIGLRECLNRCVEAVGGVRAALLASEGPRRDLREARHVFFTVLAQLFSGKIVREDTKSPPWNVLPTALQHKAGITPTADPFHWSAVFSPMQQASHHRLTQNSVGCLALECMDAKDKNTAWLLTCMSELLNDYQERVQQVESFVYMECVGIQLERHFSEKRAAALAAFEKKTDITTAINVANKKKLPKLVEELQRKLDEIGNEVTQTTVREAKELHLESKQLKSDIHDLAVRRLVRARETSTERAVSLMSLWAKEEESSAAAELKAIGEAIAALEYQLGEEDLDVQGKREFVEI